jgi:hypothetical protein
MLNIVAGQTGLASPNCSSRCASVCALGITAFRLKKLIWPGSSALFLSNDKRHPRGLAENDISSFLSSLAIEGRVAASTQNQALSALLFLYKEALT